jgi:hypothetical protein
MTFEWNMQYNVETSLQRIFLKITPKLKSIYNNYELPTKIHNS